MNASQTAVRRTSLRSLRSSQWSRHASSAPPPPPPQPPRGQSAARFIGYGVAFGAAAAGSYYYPTLKEIFVGDNAPVEIPKAQPEFEKPRKIARSAEENRELLSSQHLQVQKSWEHPGVYLWGSNVGRVVDPESKDKYVKLPRRLKLFDDQLLRDLKLTQAFGAAINEKGDLIQWGLGFSNADPSPVVTIKGKDLAKIDVSADRIIALSKNGTVYAIPSSRDDLGGLVKQSDKSSWSLWSSGQAAPSLRDITPSSLGWSERVADISSGLDHCLLLTSSGRVFAAASSSSDFPAKGQMGIPGLTWETRPKGHYDQPHEISALKGFKAAQIATGDYHSAVLDSAGRIFTFGDNLYGQLGCEVDISESFINTPTILPIKKLYKGTGLAPTVTGIMAGGNNLYFTVDSEASQDSTVTKSAAPARRMPGITTDFWAAGQGVYGSLGTGRWTHVSQGPTKVKALSSLFEFDESANKLIPIKLKSVSVGATHCAAIMDNVTETSIARRARGDNDVNWGADVVFWGGNEHYQLGTGKRSNQNAPVYIGPLDGGQGDSDKGRKGERHRLALTPRETARLGEGGKGRKVTLEQKVECGRYVTGVYSSV
ncbi:uncharacterized protein J7T54_000286 [Emericellopsis cladophorae]|uniref:Mitochondrial protein Fmp25 n=1 Tax=Emericellopsis cladophorae TaxID=2686198 RepID=A0A9P9XYU8_9HYPO|nr:uncharacterized protein J7T54_000286 [Emericellopsis cladophorae]KAI6779985.1 hypothetical protein J7T54_000286 [Emericellopsis cladophorae]